MSEKRFIFATNEKWFLFDNETEDFMDMEDCKDKLNELAEENEQLKKARDKSDKFIVKKGLEIEFLEWCMK